jgi:hypothetical protein
MIGIAGAASSVIAYEGARTYSKLSGEAAKSTNSSSATIPSTFTANPSDFTQKIGLPDAPSKIPGSVSILPGFVVAPQGQPQTTPTMFEVQV